MGEEMKGQVMTEDLLNYAEEVSNQLDGLAGANVSTLIASHRALSSQIEELQKALKEIAEYTNPTGEDGREMVSIARYALKGASQ